MINKIKFEYVFAILVVIILAAALFVFKSNDNMTNMIMTALVGALSAITAFFFTNTQVGKVEKEDVNKIPEKAIEPDGEPTEIR